MTKEKIEQFKKEQIEYCNKEIANLEIAVADLKKQQEKDLSALEDKLEILKYQKGLYE